MFNLKKIFKNKKIGDDQFILGIDLGDSTSSICYFDINRKTPEIIDISGGYGKANMPTVVQYIPKTKEWVFGEYAILNKGIEDEITFSSIIDKLGKKEYVEIDGKLESVVGLIGLYLKELIDNCKNINPRADIAGIVVAIPHYISGEALEDLKKAFALIGYDKKVLAYISDRECIFTNYYYDKPAINENILLLDYGSRELRGIVFKAVAGGDIVELETLSYMYNEKLGTRYFEDKVNQIFIDLYMENTKIPRDRIKEETMEEIKAFAYQNKDIIFQRNIFNKDVKLYYNFVYPPFQASISREEADDFLLEFRERFANFIETLLFTNIRKDIKKIEVSDINTVICVGGGFEMLWIRELVEEIFPDSHIREFDNPKGAISEGASIIAANYLDIIDIKEVMIKDNLQLKEDIGIFVSDGEKDIFVPIIERNNFWWQSKNKIRFIVNEKIEDEFAIDLYTRNYKGKTKKIGGLLVSDFPERTKGTSKFEIRLSFLNIDEIKINLIDLGFGEFYKSTGMDKEYIIER